MPGPLEITRYAVSGPGSCAGPRGPEERVICLALVTTWMLITGRHMPLGVLPHELAGTDLINFWADDFPSTPRPVALRPCPPPGPATEPAGGTGS